MKGQLWGWYEEELVSHPWLKEQYNSVLCHPMQQRQEILAQSFYSTNQSSNKTQPK